MDCVVLSVWVADCLLLLFDMYVCYSLYEKFEADLVFLC